MVNRWQQVVLAFTAKARTALGLVLPLKSGIGKQQCPTLLQGGSLPLALGAAATGVRTQDRNAPNVPGYWSDYRLRLPGIPGTGFPLICPVARADRPRMLPQETHEGQAARTGKPGSCRVLSALRRVATQRPGHDDLGRPLSSGRPGGSTVSLSAPPGGGAGGLRGRCARYRTGVCLARGGRAPVFF